MAFDSIAVNGSALVCIQYKQGVKDIAMVEVSSTDSILQTTSISSLKILINPADNSIGISTRTSVKPTSSQVEFHPGLPPGWTKPPTSYTKPHIHWQSTTSKSYYDSISASNNTGHIAVTEVIDVDSLFTDHENVTATSNSTEYPPGVLPPEPIVIGEPDRGGPIDWFLGLIGIKPNTESNNQQHSPIAPARHCSRCTCGITFKHNRIVGGIETQVNEYTWMTALMHNNRFYCGGSIINSKYVLTAGHCVNGLLKDRLSAVFLDHDRSTTTETVTITRKIQNIIQHKAYGSGGTYNNDIALLELDSDLVFSERIRPVCLPAIGRSFTGHKGIVIGWGATQSQGHVSYKLREVEVPILSNIDCKKTGYGTRITDNMLCAGYSHGTKDSCQGDSGGPLHVINGSYHSIVGVVSWGEGCAEANYPGVYTRVNRYLSWIYSNTKDGCYCNS